MGREIQTGQERLAGRWTARWAAWWEQRSRVGKIALVLLGVIVLCTFGLMVDVLPTLDTTLITLCGMALTPLVLILLYRWLVYRVLWKVRNRLIMTYLLMGLAPVVMFAMLAGVTAYMLAGQYSTNIGMEQINLALRRVRDQAATAVVMGQAGEGKPKRAAMIALPKRSAVGLRGADGSSNTDEPDADDLRAADVAKDEDAEPISVMAVNGGAWAPLDGEKVAMGPLTDIAPPAWLHPGFEGVVDHAGLLYLCAEVSAPRNGKTVMALGSRPLTRDELNVMAKGLGRIVLSQSFSKLAADKDDDTANDVDEDAGGKAGAKIGAKAEKKARKTDEDADDDADGTEHIHAGKGVNVNLEGVLSGAHFDAVASAPLEGVRHRYLDPPVVFYTSLPVTGWRTGGSVHGMMAVYSRPSYLYARLFASSVTKGKIIWGVLIGIAAFFAMVEFFALAMATTLSWSITRSVAELYRGTREVDAGHLEHRIPVKRKDQLAALATSFNGMAASVSELMVQQREKERLLNELAIAQEVQSTLFPKSPAVMGNLEVHGTCIPARTVGGDYFDFIFGYGPGYGPDGGPGGHVTLALGDISGKGISAALLMSALHSADRAFSATVQDGVAPSPARLLKLLNEHLYRSTQSARYATLFLASYDPATRRLTYSNGGHLPPVVISADGSVQRLEVGGAVVGLLEGMEYEEATVQLQPGDLFMAYTDGLTEPERNGEDFGEQRLVELVRAHRTEPLTVLATNTLHAVKLWIGDQEQPDDMTIVLARSYADGEGLRVGG